MVEGSDGIHSHGLRRRVKVIFDNRHLHTRRVAQSFVHLDQQGVLNVLNDNNLRFFKGQQSKLPIEIPQLL